MNWFIVGAVAWIVLSIPAAVFIGKALKRADRKEQRHV